LVRRLVIQADEVIKQRMLDGYTERVENRLLRVLHSSWLYRNYPWSFHRFRHRDNLYRPLCVGFEEVNLIQLLPMGPVGEYHLPVREVVLQARRPFSLDKLLIADQGISSRSRAVLRPQIPVIDLTIHARKCGREKKSPNTPERCEIRFVKVLFHFLLTLEELSKGGIGSPLSAIEAYLAEQQR
jgi:hypothetical protein